MKTTRWTLWLAAFVAQLAISLTALGQAQNPEDLVKSTSDEVLGVIRQTHDRQKLQQLAQEKVVPHFDFERMTQLAMGRAWRQATPDQQHQLEEQFRELLVRTYTNAMAAGTHGNAKIRFKPSHGAANAQETVVRTEAIEPGRAPVAIDYAMEKKPDGWKVYDVMVDSVSLVTNYRGQFESTVSQSGIDGLIHSLSQKNKGQAG
ncbi:MAG TPA: ABC transporter substrate-binding protein [Rhodocyclaceae bacterium]